MWKKYCKQTIIRNDFISQLNWDELDVATNFRDKALSTPFFFNYNYVPISGLQQEIFATMRFSQILRKISCIQIKIGLQYIPIKLPLGLLSEI